MNKLKLGFLATVLLSGSAFATSHCNGFQIKIKNTLLDDLKFEKVFLSGAVIQPDGMDTLKGNGTEIVFVVNESEKSQEMTGEFILKTVTIPEKFVRIKYTLRNSDVNCKHDVVADVSSDYNVNKHRIIGGVNYTIVNP